MGLGMFVGGTQGGDLAHRGRAARKCLGKCEGACQAKWSLELAGWEKDIIQVQGKR